MADLDVNKVVAAILTAGRVPTLADQPRPMDDWLAEYTAWISALEHRDADLKEAAKRRSEQLMAERAARR